MTTAPKMAGNSKLIVQSEKVAAKIAMLFSVMCERKNKATFPRMPSSTSAIDGTIVCIKKMLLTKIKISKTEAETPKNHNKNTYCEAKIRYRNKENDKTYNNSTRRYFLTMCQ